MTEDFTHRIALRWRVAMHQAIREGALIYPI